MIVGRVTVIRKGALLNLIIIHSALLFLAVQADASETCYMDTPSGFQRMGGASRIGPYSSSSECESVNRQHFKGAGNCSCKSSPPGYQQPPEKKNWRMQQQQQEEERWRKAEEHRRQEAEEARKREEANKKQFEQDKHKALKLLKSGSEQLEPKTVSSGEVKLKSTEQTGLKLRGLKEPRLSKGTKHSAPVDLKTIPPDKPVVVSPESMKLKTAGREKGLKTGYVPKPARPSLADYHYEKKSRTDIVLDALEVGSGSFVKSVRHLEKYLVEVDPNNVKVQEALSYIQGMSEGDFATKENDRNQKGKQGPFDPSPDDSSALLEAVAGQPRLKWPGPTVNPDQAIPLANPLDWKSVRKSAIAEALSSLSKDTEKLTREDLQKCIQSLENQVQKNPDANGYSQAIQFFKGAITYY